MMKSWFFPLVAALALATAETKAQPLQTATFAGGCFWCMEKPFDTLKGVKSTTVGYAGGSEVQPKYKEVASGKTGHREAVRIQFDPSVISYQQLLEVFWRQINPTDIQGQFVDRGFQYSPAIFYHSPEQQRQAAASKVALGKTGRFSKEIVVPIEAASSFYKAEAYHQDYYKKNPLRYWYYRRGSGRDQYLDTIWKKKVETPTMEHKTYKKPDDATLRTKLSNLQYKVTQKDGTEPPFNNPYWDNKAAGIYVDVVSGEPLFSSTDKYQSGTGWPSFTRPIDPQFVVTKEDRKLFTVRTEVRSKFGDTHLGHVFDDGPRPTNLRYCINSASLRFIPVVDLEKEGYGQYLSLFKDQQENTAQAD